MRPDADVGADGDAAGRVQEGRLADPRAAPDDELVLVVALQDRVVPDVDVLVERDVLGMEDERARLEHHRAGQRRSVAR